MMAFRRSIIINLFIFCKLINSQYSGTPISGSYNSFLPSSPITQTAKSARYEPAGQIYPAGLTYPPVPTLTYPRVTTYLQGANYPPGANYEPGVNYPSGANYPSGVNYPAYPSPRYPSIILSNNLPTQSVTKCAPVGPVALKCNPPTAIAYYLTEESPKVFTREVKEISEKAPSYPCPFCTGFADVPRNSKIAPPPPSGSVLPGLLDNIPTVTLPDELLKIKDLITPSPLLCDLEKKLTKKLRFDQDLLDGFLTGLGLGP